MWRPEGKSNSNPLSRKSRTLFLCSFCCFLGVPAFSGSPVEAAAPKLTHLFPAGGQRGTKVVVTCSGEFDWPVKVWAPGVETTATKDKGKLEVSIPKDLAADRVWIRFHNAEGISSAAPFLIGGLQDVNETEPNNTPGGAQKLEANCTINGVLHTKGELDGFAVQLKAGQTLVAAVDANSRLGSPMDAILQVATSRGIVLAENHDDVGLDPRLAFTANQDGTYVVRIFAFASNPNTSIAFHGGDNYIYRLTVTTGPFITHANPMSVPQSDPGSIEPVGWNIPSQTRLPVVPFGGGTENLREFESFADNRNPPGTQLGLVFADGFAGAARVRMSPHSINRIKKPNDSSSETLAAPTSFVGCLRAPKQTDSFRVPLKKGEPTIIAVESQSLHLPMVPLVRLTDPDGKTAAEFLETGPAQDAIITHTPTKDGDYQLTIRDRYRNGGSRYFYRLTLRTEEPDFELAANVDNIVVKPDKPAEITITVKRRNSPAGKIGPLRIEALHLPPGVTSSGVVSEPTGDTSGKVTIKLSTAGPAFSGPIRIRGTAQQPRDITRFAVTPPKQATSIDQIWLTAVAKLRD